MPVRQRKRYLGLVDTPHVITIDEGDEAVRAAFASPADEFGIALTLLRLREEAGEAFRPTYNSLQHIPEDTGEIEEMFGCPIRGCHDSARPRSSQKPESDCGRQRLTDTRMAECY